LLRKCRAQKRDRRREISLTIRVEESQERVVTLAELTRSDRIRAHRGVTVRDEYEQIDLRTDLASAVAELPAEAQELAEQLQTRTTSEIARDLGIPRSTLQSRISRRLKPLQRESLRDYL
jgi:DNA-directed RNA polymerase specialized sigma24 family protein